MNTGNQDGEEVVQVFLSPPDSDSPINPIRWRAAYPCIFLRAGEKQKITLKIRSREMATFDSNGSSVIEPGTLLISVGGQQPGYSGCLKASSPKSWVRKLK
ncbi:MAG: fibronectin type III-like domain-contianing protein [Candidatus Aminicenantales bacterium]